MFESQADLELGSAELGSHLCGVSFRQGEARPSSLPASGPIDFCTWRSKTRVCFFYVAQESHAAAPALLQLGRTEGAGGGGHRRGGVCQRLRPAAPRVTAESTVGHPWQ